MMTDYYQKSMKALQLAGISERTQKDAAAKNPFAAASGQKSVIRGQ